MDQASLLLHKQLKGGSGGLFLEVCTCLWSAFLEMGVAMHLSFVLPIAMPQSLAKTRWRVSLPGLWMTATSLSGRSPSWGHPTPFSTCAPALSRAAVFTLPTPVRAVFSRPSCPFRLTIPTRRQHAGLRPRCGIQTVCESTVAR